jgi:hypothetical protein
MQGWVQTMLTLLIMPFDFIHDIFDFITIYDALFVINLNSN